MVEAQKINSQQTSQKSDSDIYKYIDLLFDYPRFIHPTCIFFVIYIAELIKSLTHQIQKGGQYSIKWNGLGNGGKPCKPGVYLIVLSENGISTNPNKIIKR